MMHQIKLIGGPFDNENKAAGGVPVVDGNFMFYRSGRAHAYRPGPIFGDMQVAEFVDLPVECPHPSLPQVGDVVTLMDVKATVTESKEGRLSLLWIDDGRRPVTLNGVPVQCVQTR